VGEYIDQKKRETMLNDLRTISRASKDEVSRRSGKTDMSPLLETIEISENPDISHVDGGQSDFTATPVSDNSHVTKVS